MTNQELTAAISANLREISDLNDSIRAISAGLNANLQTGHCHLLTQVEVKTMRISNLLFWVNHWNQALCGAGA